jgi:CheY-like chemotaxis protein
MAVKCSILVVEDEPLIAMMLEDFLLSLGHDVVATCDSLADALAFAEKGGFDLAILDVNLKGENIWPAAAVLRDKGIAFMLASGGLVERPPEEFAAAPMIEKPYTIDRVEKMVEQMATGAPA